MAVETQRQHANVASGALCEVRQLGAMPYDAAQRLQEQLVEQRSANRVPDQLLLLQHPHVLTLGRDAKLRHVLAPEANLRALGVEQHECSRGGDVTYHGPGQLVAYPILDLRPDRCDLHRYVRDLEAVMLATLADFGVRGHVVPGRTGVWVRRDAAPEAKVGAIGVRVSRWITSHGIALNVVADLRYFDLIVPCGLAGSAVANLADLTGDATLDVERVATHFAAHFGCVFGRRMVEPPS